MSSPSEPTSTPPGGGMILFPRLLLAAVLLMALGMAAWSEPLLEGKRQSIPTNTPTALISTTPGAASQATLTPPIVTGSPMPSLTPTFDVVIENTRTNGIILWGIILVLIVLGGTLSVTARFRR